MLPRVEERERSTAPDGAMPGYMENGGGQMNSRDGFERVGHMGGSTERR